MVIIKALRPGIEHTERMSADSSPPRKPESGARDDEPVLPDVTSDEQDRGWGDDRDGGRRDEEWYRRERPPHHGD